MSPSTRAKRGLSSGSVCVHFSRAHMTTWKSLGVSQLAAAAAEISQLQRYVQDPEKVAELSSEVYRCLTCEFRGVREASSQQLQEIEDGEDDGSFMAHAILHNHVIAVLERKRQLYCASCRDFIYPEVVAGSGFRRRKRQIRSTMQTHVLLRRGLVNMGNTCFMSSVLQALAHNPMLQHYFFVAKSHDTTICQQQRRRLLLKQQQRKQQEEANEGDNEGETKRHDTMPVISVCLGCELAAFMEQLVPPRSQKSLMAPPIAPQGILEAMWNAFPSFIGTAQHDAHELLIALLGGLHSHTHPRVFVHGGASPRFTPRGHSLCDCAVHQHFSGVLRSELACSDCGEASYKFDPFLDVSLSLGNGVSATARKKNRGKTVEAAELTLESLLRIFTDEEELRGVNQVYCPRCSQYRNNSKRLTLHAIPNVLVFHIRRLDFYEQKKLSQAVRFPLTGLCMKPFTSADKADDANQKKSGVECENDYLYDLVAVVNHHGDSVNAGHYTAYVRDELSKSATPSNQNDEAQQRHQWILFDDIEVKAVSADEVEQSQAYLLCYVRRNPFIAVAA